MKDSDANVPAGIVDRLGVEERFQRGTQKPINTPPKDGSAGLPKKKERST